jgi:hypothetical protein
MLDQHIRRLHKRGIYTIIMVETFILSLYILYILMFDFHLLVFLTYVITVFISMIFFTSQYVKRQTYYYTKKVKVSNVVNHVFELEINLRDTYLLPYFLYEKDTKGKELKRILNDTQNDEILEIVSYDHTYACVKDKDDQEYITYTHNLELI